MTKEPVKTYLVRFTPDLHTDLKVASIAEGRSMNAIIEDAVTMYVAKRTPGGPLSQVSVSNLQATYQQPDPLLSARSMRSAGSSYASVVSTLGGSPEERD